MSVELADDAAGRPQLIGQVLANRYHIELHLGEGAMGSVWKARHVKVGRSFAVKVLHKKLIEDRKVLQRFEREAELAGRLRHRNVIGVVDVGETPDGFRYMVMDFAEGHDLATLLHEAPMPPARVINLTRQLLEGLYHAHEQGLIHRDFKPENVIVEKDDHGVEVPRIVDFGIAILREGGDSTHGHGRLTTNGLVLGTPHYMAPEQAVADPIDHRIDLFALGIVVYELLCGRLPFDGNGAEVARANLLLDPPPIAKRVPFLEVDPLLEAYARRLMAKQRDQRPATAKAARELLDLITSDPAAAAAALGVPIDASSRLPAVTQPSAPTRPSAVELEAPAYPIAEPAGARTELVAPLDELDPPRPRRAGRIAIAVAAVSLVTVIVLATRARDEPVAAPEPARPVIADQGSAKPVIADQGSAKPVIVDQGSSARPVIVAPPVIVDRGSARPPPVKKPPVIVKQPEVGSPRVEPPAPKPPEVLGAGELFALYQSVGADLARVAKLEPAVASEVEVAYRRIQIQDAMATEASRARHGAELQKLARRLAAVKR